MAEKIKDYYKTLEVEPDASQKEIKKAYRRLAAKYHPDVSTEEDAEVVFKKIFEANEILSDPEARKEYDEFVKRESEGKNRTFSDVMSVFKSEHNGVHAPVRGDDVKVVTYFTAEEVRQTRKRSIILDRFENCTDCGGHGVIRDLSDLCEDCGGTGFLLHPTHTPFGDMKTHKGCPRCEGKGYTKTPKCTGCSGKGKIPKKVRVSFDTPSETREEFEYRLTGRGDAGLNGGRYGNLIVVFRQHKDDPYRIIGDDLEITKEVSFLSSLTGGSVKVHLPNGENTKIPLPDRVEDGHTIIVPDYGLFNEESGRWGNLNVKIKVTTPRNLSKNQEKKIIDILSQEV